jgi:hypothetical protein
MFNQYQSFLLNYKKGFSDIIKESFNDNYNI